MMLRRLVTAAALFALAASSGCSDAQAGSGRWPAATAVATPGAYVPAPADAVAIDLTGFDGETMGGIEIDCVIQTPVIAGGGGLNAHYCFLPNAIAPVSGFSTRGDISNNVAMCFGLVGTGTSQIIRANVRMPATKTGRGPRALYGRSYTTGLTQLTTFGGWTDSTIAITSGRIEGRYTDGVALAGLNSIISSISGYSPDKSYCSWKALGRP